MSSQHPIGFAVLTHNQPEHVVRVLSTLNRLFDHPPIVVHHDNRLCDLPTELSSNIEVFHSGLETKWATFGVVEAAIIATSKLMRRPDAPRWAYLLSGNCYPICSQHKMLSDLERMNADAAVQCEVNFPKETRTEWDQLIYDRYVSGFLRIPRPSRSRGWLYQHFPLPIQLKRQPFNDMFPCRSGAAFYVVNRKGAEALQTGLDDASLANWYRKRFAPDESFYSTVLANSGIRIHKNHFHYIDWVDPKKEPEETNPRVLTLHHWDAIQRSGKHFARKIVPGRSDSLMEMLDRELVRQKAMLSSAG